jgi:hypothetical protein
MVVKKCVSLAIFIDKRHQRRLFISKANIWNFLLEALYGCSFERAFFIFEGNSIELCEIYYAEGIAKSNDMQNGGRRISLYLNSNLSKYFNMPTHATQKRKSAKGLWLKRPSSS